MRTKWKRLNFSFALPNGPLCREGGWGKHEGMRMSGETGGIAFMLVVSFGLGNFDRWLVRGAQSGLTDLTWLAEIPRQFPIIRGPDAAAQPSGLLLLFRPPSTPSAWFHSITEVRWLSMSLIHFITVNYSNKHEKKIAFIIFMIWFLHLL